MRGPNGAGKSTLLSALSGKLAPMHGRRVEGDGLALGIFTQDLAQDLDQRATALEVVTSNVRQVSSCVHGFIQLCICTTKVLSIMTFVKNQHVSRKIENSSNNPLMDLPYRFYQISSSHIFNIL